jgi:putative transposase
VPIASRKLFEIMGVAYPQLPHLAGSPGVEHDRLLVAQNPSCPAVEKVALRHQIGVVRRGIRRPKLTAVDRVFWVWLSRIWRDWRSALAIVKPETVIAWHGKGFRLFWTWKVRRSQAGRPAVSREVRDLIRRMSRENTLWDAPRIYGELLKLGIDVGETSVGTYLVRHQRPPS